MSVPGATYQGRYGDSYYDKFNHVMSGDARLKKSNDEVSNQIAQRLVNEPNLRGEYMTTTSDAIDQSLELAKTNPVDAQINLMSQLQELNAIKAAADWKTIDPAFGKLLNEKIHAINVGLNQIEKDHSALRPRDNESFNLLIRSDAAREDFKEQATEDMQDLRQLSKTDPAAAHQKAADLMNRWEVYSKMTNWDDVDKDFGDFMKAKIKEAGDVKNEIEAANPSLKNT